MQTHSPIFKPVRRKDRILSEELAHALLERGEYGVLSMHGANGYGYGIPISYVLEGEHLYFHGAPEGFKLESLALDDRVSFCVVGVTKVAPRQFSTAYESVIVFGRIASVTDEPERIHALRLLSAKYSPEYPALAEKYINVSLHRTHILRLEIEHLSGKAKRIACPTADPNYQ